MAADEPADHKWAKTEEERIERQRARNRRYREAHREQTRENLRRWKAENPDKVKEYAARFRERHLEQVRKQNRDRERAKAAKARRAHDAAERRRVKGRARYWADPDTHRDYQRERRAAQRAADPEGYRLAKKQRNKRWRDSHKQQENAKLRAKHRDNPEIKRAAAERYYAEHGDKVRERRKAYYWANREKQLEKQREWRAREKRRRGAGLPPRRLHRVSATERAANIVAADEFFAAPRSSEQIATMRDGVKTSKRELARWARDSERARAQFAFTTRTDPVMPLSASARREQERALAAARRREADAAEEARLDAIARAINDQLRYEPRRNSMPADHSIIPPITGPISRGVSR